MNDPLLQDLLEIASRASKQILHAYDQGFEVSYKGFDDPVTSADRAANELICAELARRYPGVPIVAEESDPESYEAFVSAERSFFVDPIDGTKEFIAKNGEFVIMIGLAEQGSALAGVVYWPVQETAWLARVGDAAFRVRDNQIDSIRSSGTSELHEAVLLASRSHEDEEARELSQALGVGKVQSVGSAGLKGALVAEGSADLYISPGPAGKRWDACAIDAILRASGGTLTDTHGHALDYRRSDINNEGGLLATNGKLLNVALEQIERLRAG